MRTITTTECISAAGGYLMQYNPPADNRDIVSYPISNIASNEAIHVNGQKNNNFINVGAAVGALIGGFMAGGPVGFGFALGGLVIATGVNGLINLHSQKH